MRSMGNPVQEIVDLLKKCGLTSICIVSDGSGYFEGYNHSGSFLDTEKFMDYCEEFKKRKCIDDLREEIAQKREELQKLEAQLNNLTSWGRKIETPC
jgi:hypothetical protein